MQKDGFRAVARKNMPVPAPVVMFCVKQMAKQFFTQLFEQIFLGFKMGIKGRSAHICAVYDLSHRNMIEIFFRKQLRKGVENGLSGFSLPSVHTFTPYKSRNLFCNERSVDIVC